MLRHKWKAYSFMMTMLAAAAYAFYFPKTYRSEAKLFVKLGRENAGLDATTTLGQTPSVAVPLGREEEINTEVEILGTDSLLLKAVDKIGPPAILAQTDERHLQTAICRRSRGSSLGQTRLWKTGRDVLDWRPHWPLAKRL